MKVENPWRLSLVNASATILQLAPPPASFSQSNCRCTSWLGELYLTVPFNFVSPEAVASKADWKPLTNVRDCTADQICAGGGLYPGPY